VCVVRRSGDGSSGGALASGPAARQGEDRGVQGGKGRIRAGRAVSAVPAGGVGGDVGADEAEDGGEGNGPGVDAGGSGGAGGCGGDDVVDEQERPGFLAGEVRGLAAQRAPRTVFFRWRKAVSICHLSE
jgi:hypothetical protein